MTTPTVAIIGGGASGTLLSLHLQRLAPLGTRIALIERRPSVGPGLAYSTGEPSHLLNVPAGRMSAFADQPRHFLDWLLAQPPQVLAGLRPEEGTFVPRRLYGAYLRHLLTTARHGAPLQPVHDEAVAIEGTIVRLSSGQAIAADLVVLATGNDRPAPPRHLPELQAAPNGRPDPWAPEAFSDLAPNAPVLLIGTGLTMVDAVLTLLDQGHTGPIHAVSRRGLLPRAHAPAAAAPPLDLPPHADLRTLLRLLRRQTSDAGDDWRGVIDAMRPVTQTLWQGLSFTEKMRFLRHLRPWWDVHRHRLPAVVAARIDAARINGQLQIAASRSAALDASRFARVVNCSGPCTDVTRSDDTLLRQLLRDGVVRPDPCRLSLDTTAAGAVRDRDGTVSRSIFALGPLTRGTYWEITAIPDIRRQSESLAGHVADLLHQHAPSPPMTAYRQRSPARAETVM